MTSHASLAGTGATVLVLPFAIGPYALAVETTKVAAVRAGALEGDSGTGLPTTHVDLHALLGAPRPSTIKETVVARVGRTRVAFGVDGTRALLPVPLELVRRLPEVLEPRLELPALVAVLDLEGGVRFLIDPGLLGSVFGGA